MLSACEFLFEKQERVVDATCYATFAKYSPVRYCRGGGIRSEIIKYKSLQRRLSVVVNYNDASRRRPRWRRCGPIISLPYATSALDRSLIIVVIFCALHYTYCARCCVFNLSRLLSARRRRIIQLVKIRRRNLSPRCVFLVLFLGSIYLTLYDIDVITETNFAEISFAGVLTSLNTEHKYIMIWAMAF